MIRVLDKNVADKIAAGEVIDRPVSIVKELVENSLDAEATAITVELRHGGKDYLRVTDNGQGIPPEEASLAFLRHATSKIETESDLDAIHSLGFRGEALASICAVARVDMITRPAAEQVGRHLICEGSEILMDDPAGCPEGTTITVRDLFYNVPARKKFLGTDGAESRRIIDLMSRIALAYPDVRFRLINGKQEVFHTSGQGSILDNICRIYGRDIGRDLVRVDTAADGLSLRGFVSSPGTAATARTRQFFCVNGRVVSSKTIERGLEKGYRERLFTGRYPIAFLFLQMPADQLDVNVHPTKKEVRFDAPFTVEDFIADAVNHALDANPAIPLVKTRQEPAGTGNDINGAEPTSGETAGPAERMGEEGPRKKEESQGEQVDIKKFFETLRKEADLKEPSFTYDAAEGVRPADPSTESSGTASHSPEDAPVSSDRKSGALDIAGLSVIGVAFRTYIIAEEGDTLYFIDQHAAHERVFYEQLLRQYHASEKLTQQLLLPLQISVSAEVEHAEESWIGYLRDMGYDIENFGSRTYIVRSMPAFAEPAEGEQFLRDLLLGLEHAPDPHSFASLDRLIMRSCKSAVKGGDHLHPEEIRTLLQQLSECDNPWSCPHGRPTIIRQTRQQMERMFKR